MLKAITVMIFRRELTRAHELPLAFSFSRTMTTNSQLPANNTNTDCRRVSLLDSPGASLSENSRHPGLMALDASIDIVAIVPCGSIAIGRTAVALDCGGESGGRQSTDDTTTTPAWSNSSSRA